MKFLLKKWAELEKKRQMIILSIAAAVCFVAVLTGVILVQSSGEKTETTYRETTVKRGSLSVGVTESGSVDIGTVEQTFDLDMSALQRTSTGDSSSGSSTGSGSGGDGNARRNGRL